MRRISAGLWIATALLLPVDFVVMEAGLRALEGATSPWIPQAPSPPRNGGRRLLCVGDSHMLGTQDSGQHSLPNLLSDYLRPYCARPIEAINYGRAGNPSWLAFDDVIDGIERFRPDAVLFRAGGTDGMMRDPEEGGLGSRLAIVRVAGEMARDLWDLRAPEERFVFVGFPQVDTDFLPPAKGQRRPDEFIKARQFPKALAPRPVDAAAIAAMRRGFERVVEAARRHGTLVFVAEYFESRVFLEKTNAALREACRGLPIRFLEISSTGWEAAIRLPNGEVFGEDYHLTEIGHEMEALAILRRLADAGFVEGRGIPAPISHFHARTAERELFTTLRLDLKVAPADGGGARIELKGPPGLPGRILLGAPSRPWKLLGLLVPIDAKSVLEFGASVPSRFVFDAAGTARVEVAREWLERIGPGALCTALAEVQDGPRTRFLTTRIVRCPSGEEDGARIETAALSRAADR